MTQGEREFLVAVGIHGAVREGRQWRAGGIVISRTAIGRLIRGGYLTGHRGVVRRDLTQLGRRAIAQGKAPSVGVEVIARGHNTTLRGRVACATTHEALLVPSDSPRPSPDGVPVVYVVHRPHAGAPWKGYMSPVGLHIRGPGARVLDALLPPAWRAPLTSRPHTAARLVEVSDRLALIGARPTTVEEKAAEAALPLSSVRWWLRVWEEQRRRRARAYKLAAEVPAHERYLSETIRRDPAPFLAAELDAAIGKMKRDILPTFDGAARSDMAAVRPLEWFIARHREMWILEDTVSRAYPEVEAWARDVVTARRERQRQWDARLAQQRGTP